MTASSLSRRLLASPRGPAAGAALACAALADPALAHRGHPDGDRHIVAEATSIVADHLVRTASTVQVGSDPVNRFQMVRVVREDLRPFERRGALLVLPPISGGFENYEVSDDGDYAQSFAAFFAERGYDVWGLSQRTEGLVAGQCESGAVDCSAMRDWGLQTLLDDAGFVRERIMDHHPRNKPVIGGISLGSIASIALLDAHPDDYAGAFLQEGTLYDANPADRAIAQGFCAQLDSQLAQGVYFDGQQLPGLRFIAGLATADPAGPSPLPGFPAGLTNHQAFVAVMSAPGIGPLTPRPGYSFLSGDAQQDLFSFADDALARANIATFVDYTALHTVRDIDCGLAGETTFTSKLSHYHGPVFMNAGGHGFGPAMLDTAVRMTGAELTINYAEPFGHMDHFFATNHRQLTEEPILAWLEDEVLDR